MNKAGKEVYDLKKISNDKKKELFSIIKKEGISSRFLFIEGDRLFLSGILKVSNLGLNRLLTEDARVRI